MDQTGAFFMGLLAGPLCYFSIQIKERMGFDDALDAFGVHGVGGVIGGILTGFFANKKISGSEDANGLFYGRPKQVYIQLYGIVVVAAYSFVMTLILLKGLDAALKAMTGIGIRVTEVQCSRCAVCSVLIACRHLPAYSVLTCQCQCASRAPRRRRWRSWGSTCPSTARPLARRTTYGRATTQARRGMPQTVRSRPHASCLSPARPLLNRWESPVLLPFPPTTEERSICRVRRGVSGSVDTRRSCSSLLTFPLSLFSVWCVCGVWIPQHL